MRILPFLLSALAVPIAQLQQSGGSDPRVVEKLDAILGTLKEIKTLLEKALSDRVVPSTGGAPPRAGRS